MSDKITKVDSHVQKLEEMLLTKATIVQDLNHFLLFYYSYLNAYFPLLEFAVEALPESSITRIANFGMLIDDLSRIQLARALAIQQDAYAREISLKTSKQPAHVLALLSDLTIAQKVSIGETLIGATSVGRDALLSCAQSKFSAINKIVTWSNVFGHVVRFPTLASALLNDEIVSQAEAELVDARNRILDKDRAFDRSLSLEWFPAVGLPQRVIEEIPKYFVGAKLTWLYAMQGLEATRAILRKDSVAADRAILMNDKLQACLTQETIGIDEWSYRDVGAGGPCCDVWKIVQSTKGKPLNLQVVDSQTVLVTSPETQYFLNLPGRLSYYTSPAMRVQINQSMAIPVDMDPNTVARFYRHPAHFFCQNMGKLALAKDCSFLHRLRRERTMLEELRQGQSSVLVTLKLTYGDALNSHVRDIVSRLTESAFEASLLYGIVCGLEKLAIGTGLDLGTWSVARWAIAYALLQKIKPFAEKANKMSIAERASVEEKAARPIASLSAEDRIRLLNDKILESEKEMCDAIEQLKDVGLRNVMGLVWKIRDILLSGLSPDDTVAALKTVTELVHNGMDFITEDELKVDIATPKPRKKKQSAKQEVSPGVATVGGKTGTGAANNRQRRKPSEGKAEAEGK